MSIALITYVAEAVPFDNSTNEFVSEECQAAIVEARDTAVGVNSRYVTNCGFDGDANEGRYLEYFEHLSSEDTPFVIPELSSIKALSVSTKELSTAEVEVLINAVIVYTLTMVGTKSGFVSGLSIPLNAGDQISVKVISGSLKKGSLFGTFIRTEI